MGWKAAYCLQITLTLAPSSLAPSLFEHRDPMYTYLFSSMLSDGWSHHLQQHCPSLLQITVNSCTSLTSSLQADRARRCLPVQTNICQARRRTEVSYLFCIPGTALACASLHGVSAGLQHRLCMCFCLTIPLVPLWILCHAHWANAMAVLYNLQARLSGFLGLASSNCFVEG